jgi:tetratricopeptide (TPR) repeat protein
MVFNTNLKFRAYILIGFLLNSLTTISQQQFICGFNNSTPQTFCDFTKTNTNVQSVNFLSTVFNLMNSISLPQNFILMECESIDNAFAMTKNGVRYIVIDKNWINNFDINDWFIKGILAHEIGHHLCGHTLNKSNLSLEQRRNQELEADKFAGFILKNNNATINEALQAINKIVPKEYDDQYSTHPSRSKRINAIISGYNNSKYKENTYLLSTTETSENYLNKAIEELPFPSENSTIGELNNAIVNCEKAIDLDKSNSHAFYLLAQYWMYIGQKTTKSLKIEFIERSIDYFLDFLKLEPNNWGALNNIGYAYNHLGYYFNDYNSYLKAIEYLSKSIQINPSGMAYHNRGISYLNFGYQFRQPTLQKACSDFYNACQLGEIKGCNEYQKACRR